MLVKSLRNGLGMIIVFVSWLTQPKPIKRNEIDQAQAQEDTQGLALYQLYACPFCVKTRRAIHRLNITIEIRDIGKQASYRQELEQQGGRVKVPCLRIEEQGEVRWMYESSDIVSYLDQRVA
jgi:glutaredoxin